MSRFLTRKVALIAALLVALAIAAAAVAASGGSSTKPRTITIEGSSTRTVSNRHTGRARSRRDGHALVVAAANYLGITVAQLRRELRSGKSLAQIARETPGRSEAGLVHAILAAQRAKLSVASEKLSAHVKAQVQLPGGPADAIRLRSLTREAAGYLGLSAAQLRSDRRAGESLAQIAQSTSGKSSEGLVAGLVAARKRELEAAVKAGTLSAAAESSRVSSLEQRISAMVNRTPHARRGRAARTTTATS